MMTMMMVMLLVVVVVVTAFGVICRFSFFLPPFHTASFHAMTM